MDAIKDTAAALELMIEARNRGMNGVDICIAMLTAIRHLGCVMPEEVRRELAMGAYFLADNLCTPDRKD